LNKSKVKKFQTNPSDINEIKIQKQDEKMKNDMKTNKFHKTILKKNLRKTGLIKE